MGRSVSTHRHAVQTVFLYPAELQNVEDDFAWDDFLSCLRDNIRMAYPSLADCDRWQDREDHVILENRLCEISVSEYCGLVAVCLAPLEPGNPLQVSWCERAKFSDILERAFPSEALRSIGRASNGEQFFRRAEVCHA